MGLDSWEGSADSSGKSFLSRGPALFPGGRTLRLREFALPEAEFFSDLADPGKKSIVITMQFKAIIFDLDGTLVNTLADIAGSMNKALARRNFPPLIPSEYANLVGWGIRRLALLALPDEERKRPGAEDLAAEIAQDAARFYAESPLTHSKPYPGMLDAAAELKRKKIKIGVATNKPDPVARLVLQGLFPLGTFDKIQGDKPGGPRKPDPSVIWDMLIEMNATPRETMIVGDSEIDMETAQASNCHAVGVSWGYRPRGVLEKAGAERIIDTPEAFLDFIADL
ncbi:MAG: HAD family hydrolase [Spirochaetaceae bacterium]|nr:HAD family hydrolase [Spirochaetaceae bacterium]